MQVCFVLKSVKVVLPGRWNEIDGEICDDLAFDLPGKVQ